MKLSKEQFDALKPYEENFRTMANAQWSRHPGRAGIETMVDIRDQVTGRNEKNRFRSSCRDCVMRLIKEVGAIYLEDLKERNRIEVGEIRERKEAVKMDVKTQKGRKGGRNRSETKSR